ncbi:MAG: hypothetical protein CVV37_04635 [Nitrospira bacterium HGW-Nitrospira-1]|nr:MAG: hypothetical protein CVV37_04635 [Nitrospira bacterium HGW-Nitrospira-1]
MEPVKIVIRYADGKTIKGFSYNFSPNKHLFHIKLVNTDEVVEVLIKELKAVFFVRDFAGNPSYDEWKQFDKGPNQPGRRIEVTFTDGEVLVGSTTGYDPQRLGFSFSPVDPNSNNVKVFVIFDAVKKIRYL